MTLLWPEIQARRPDARVVVVRRPVAEVVASCRAMGLPEAPGAVSLIEKIDAQADAIARLPGVFAVPYERLRLPWVCQLIALHTLGRNLPISRVRELQRQNIQANPREVAARLAMNSAGFINVFGQHLALH